MRVDAHGEFKDSAPCRDCSETLKKFKIKRLIYSNCEGNLVTCKMCNYESNHVTSGHRNSSYQCPYQFKVIPKY